MPLPQKESIYAEVAGGFLFQVSQMGSPKELKAS